MWKRVLPALVPALLLAASALAQPAPPPSTPPPLPPETQTPPPPKAEAYTPGAPPATDATPDPDEPQVTIIRQETQTIEEVRIGGQLRYIRVTPRFGRPYFLVPTGNGTQFIRRDSLDPALSVPMWQLFSW
ncbi:MAG: DUF2782 domain-containing protein [Burkholderiales bacterium]